MSARLDSAGTVLDPAPGGLELPASKVDPAEFGPAAAFDGTNYLVVWEDGRNGGRDIYGVRIVP